MQHNSKSVTTINSYIKLFPKELQKTLTQLKQLIKSVAPQAEEAIKYQMPTFVLKGKNLVHFASYQKHIGFYPTPSPISLFKKELSGYKTSKGAIQFPIEQPLPLKLIKKITKYRVKEISNKL